MVHQDGLANPSERARPDEPRARGATASRHAQVCGLAVSTERDELELRGASSKRAARLARAQRADRRARILAPAVKLCSTQGYSRRKRLAAYQLIHQVIHQATGAQRLAWCGASDRRAFAG